MQPEKQLRHLLSAHVPEEHIVVEIPPDPKLGDLAVPCFQFAKAEGKKPHDVAKHLAKEVKPEPPFKKFTVHGPYLNAHFDRHAIASHVLTDWQEPLQREETILFEYPAPNTNKPLHLGHLRNLLLGSATAAICEAAGYNVVRTNLYNDRGIHICKSMLAYQKWGGGKTPEEMGLKPDHFVGHWYVEYAIHEQNDPSLAQEAQELLKKWEKKDKKTRQLWHQMNEWAYQGFDLTYERLGIEFDNIFYESEYFEDAKKIVRDAHKKKLLVHDDKKNLIVDLGKLGKKVLLRADGTSVYMTQDLVLATLRQKEFHPDRQVYVVGSEQEHHFKQLFAVLKLLDLEHAENLYHLSYGMIHLQEGRMKSREGTVVDIDNLLEKMEDFASYNIRRRHAELSDIDVAVRARPIAEGALRYFILKFEPTTSFTYDHKESLSFEGDTGPYIQYAVARINSIFRDEGAPPEADLKKLKSNEEWELISLMRQSQSIIDEAAEKFRPHLVARHAMNIAQAFTEFYHKHPVLKEKEKVKAARLLLLKHVREHLIKLLLLLGIDTLEEM